MVRARAFVVNRYWGVDSKFAGSPNATHLPLNTLPSPLPLITLSATHSVVVRVEPVRIIAHHSEVLEADFRTI